MLHSNGICYTVAVCYFHYFLNIQSVQLCVEFFIGHWRKISFLKLYLIDFLTTIVEIFYF